MSELNNFERNTSTNWNHVEYALVDLYKLCRFDEMSKYDIPALIDYILKVTGSKDLFFLGYSMGGWFKKQSFALAKTNLIFCI